MNKSALNDAGTDPRERILDAALRVIAAGGVDAVRHRKVATEAGVSPGSITYHFASRRELVRSAFLHFLELNTRFLHDIRERAGELDAESLVGALAEMVRLEFADPSRVLAEYELILHAARDAELADDFRRWERTTSAELAEILETLGAPRPFAAARTIMELVRGYELLRLVGARQDDLPERLSSILHTLLTEPPPEEGTR